MLALPYIDESYQAPGPEEVAQLIKLTGWSQNDAAKIVGVTWNAKKGASTIRKWKTDISKGNYRPIPYAVWRCFVRALLRLMNALKVSVYIKMLSKLTISRC